MEGEQSLCESCAREGNGSGLVNSTKAVSGFFLFALLDWGPHGFVLCACAIFGNSPGETVIYFKNLWITFSFRPQIKREDPLSLSIFLSGGQETNRDSLSSGERSGKT